MDKTNSFLYHDRKIDVALLKKVAGQGIALNVGGGQLTAVREDEHPYLILVATGEKTYDVLAGTIKPGKQQARLISKIILKKAVVQPPQPPVAQRFDDRPRFDRFERDDRHQRYDPRDTREAPYYARPQRVGYN